MSRSLIRLQIHTFFGGCMPIFALFTLLLVDHGMKPEEVSVLLVASYVSGFVLEVPSSILADRASRKWVLVAGQVLLGAAFALWALAPGFTSFLVGMILWGAQMALASGTYEAYVYDELAACGRQDEYIAVHGKLVVSRSVAALLAALCAAPLSYFGYAVVLWFSVASALISLSAACLLPEAPRVKQSGQGAYLRILRRGCATVVRDRKTLVTAIGLAAIAALLSLTGDFGQVLGRLSGLPQYAIGLFVAAGYGMLALSGAAAGKVAGRMGRSFGWVFPVAALAFIAAALIADIPSLALVWAWLFAMNLLQQLHDNELQQETTSDVRATVSSVVSLGATVLQVALTLAIGAAADAWSYATAIRLFGLTALAFGLILLCLRRFARF